MMKGNERDEEELFTFGRKKHREHVIQVAKVMCESRCLDTRPDVRLTFNRFDDAAFKTLTTFLIKSINPAHRCIHPKKWKLSLCCFLTEHHAMKAYCESGCIAPRIL
jgi:hypothetical protein